ncbi:MAG: hypothetical protein IPN47_25830 [Gemmatimonadetes bacterium]|nr:hypothetical protein [Gemmatimonadota bacterium]
MTSTTKQMVKGGKRVARKTLDKVETEVMAAAGGGGSKGGGEEGGGGGKRRPGPRDTLPRDGG